MAAKTADKRSRDMLNGGAGGWEFGFYTVQDDGLPTKTGVRVVRMVRFSTTSQENANFGAFFALAATKTRLLGSYLWAPL